MEKITSKDLRQAIHGLTFLRYSRPNQQQIDKFLQRVAERYNNDVVDLIRPIIQPTITQHVRDHRHNPMLKIIASPQFVGWVKVTLALS